MFGDSALPVSTPIAPRSDRSRRHGSFALVAAIAREIASAASEEQHRGFFAAVGARLAASVPLDAVDDVASLASRVNVLWDELGLGHATITAEADGILVRHDGIDSDLRPDVGEAWRALLPPLCEGAYDRWFRTLGSGPALVTIAYWNGPRLEIRHGR